ncbi:prespore vesicle protein-like [Sitodiplosis mosellana]|uniref:prespore vesicle protein-like n=1 Tax=Sitodiplosis mosellana TaxID=263140 RepID=UPI0024448926|nr:prespore vesicle protein-like [Sitodiplosis mosellana]
MVSVFCEISNEKHLNMKTFAVVLSILAHASAGLLPSENLLPPKEGYAYPASAEAQYHHAPAQFAVQEVHASPAQQFVEAAPAQISVKVIQSEPIATPAPIAIQQFHAAPAPQPVQQFQAAPAPQVVKVISEPAPVFYSGPAQAPHLVAPQVQHTQQIIKVIQRIAVPAPKPLQIIKLVQQRPAPNPVKIIKVINSNNDVSSSGRYSGWSSLFNSFRGSSDNGPSPNVRIIKIIKAQPEWNW